ncbi:hypothetical protein T11_18382 [Trichinella zimbabwensis]|uniref:Uncharacterized protein n=1 Tax=Trichinella zimbabwensis TaxID=268475 RepID=A0A0V1HE21_9BILA|nr:hypothetical protein T11_18382 [Trichinella zimbabwensis]
MRYRKLLLSKTRTKPHTPTHYRTLPLIFKRNIYICNNHCCTAALLITGPAEFKDAAGQDRGWLLATVPHDPTSRHLISRCSAGRSVIPCAACRSVIDQRVRRSLVIRWGSGSKPPRNKPLIYRRAASQGAVSKTIGYQISVTHPGAPLRRNPSIYWSGEERSGALVFGARVVTDVETCNTCGSVFRGCPLEDETERARRNKHRATADELEWTWRKQTSRPHPAARANPSLQYIYQIHDDI